MTAQPHRRELVIGITGSGKTTHVRGRIEHARRVVAWSPKPNDYAEQLPRLSAYDAFRVLVDDGGGDLRAAVVPSWRTPDELQEEFALFVDGLRFRGSQSAPLLVIVDECSLLRGDGRQALEVLACVGRDWGVELVMVSQRATHFPPSARDQASSIVAFRQTNPDDIKALCERTDDERWLALRSLERYKSIRWDESEAWR